MSKRIVILGVLVALTAAGLLILGPLGTRAGLWGFATGFSVLRWSVYTGLAGAALSLVGGLLSRRWAHAAFGILLGLAVAAVPWQLQRSARGVPPINDITTDIDDPPAFVAILNIRSGATSSPDYDGPEEAAAQRKAYPDIQTLRLPIAMPEAFARALAVARELGWEIVASEEPDHIEAVATTRWFGFKDDIVIRVRDEAGGSRIDIRSKSRVGRGDAGANAARIRQFLAAMREGE
jgi:uncharacterized protein (DUF1499 family)